MLTETQRLADGVVVDWHTMLVTSTDGRHGSVVDVRHAVDHDNFRSSLNIMVSWSDGSLTMFTTLSAHRVISQDGPCEKRRLH